MDQYANLIQQSVAQNNAWSAEQAQKQMDFQERMSNTAHQREIADLKASGLNPVLSAKLGGASTPSGAMAQGDTSGTSALIDLLQLSMETANSAAGAARAAASSASSAFSASSNVEDNSASDLEDVKTLGDILKMEQDENGYYHFTKEGDKQLRETRNKVMNVVGNVPVIGNTLKKVVKFGFDNAETALNTLNKGYTFNSAKESQLKANQMRLKVENYKQKYPYGIKSNGGR